MMRISSALRVMIPTTLTLALLNSLMPSATAAEPYAIEMVAEARLAQIPAGPLY